MRIHKPTKTTNHGSVEWGDVDEKVYENINDRCNNFEYIDNSVPNSTWVIPVTMG